ncbi:unnamed protein product [Amaranthus hypochondriacus]
MSVEEYTQKFMEYAGFCPIIVPDDATMPQKYEDGLSFKIQKKLGGGNMERILKREKEILGRNKRKDHGGNSQIHGQDKMVRYNNGGNHQNIRNNNNNNNQARQGDANKKPFICKRCNKSHPGFNCQGERIRCYGCGEPGHKSNQCPKGSSNHKGQNGGYNNNGSHNGNGGGTRNHQVPHKNNQGQNNNRGPTGTNSNNNINGNGNGARPTNGRIHVMSRSKANNTDVVTGTFLVNSHPAFILFDSGASHSFISKTFVEKHALKPTAACLANITMSTGESVPSNSIFQNIPITIVGTYLPSNLYLFSLEAFDIILGMD